MLLFLGAGASVPFGVPATFQFIELIKREIANYDTAASGRLIENLGDIYGGNFDLEVLLTVLKDLELSPSDLEQKISTHTAKILFSRDDGKKILREGAWQSAASSAAKISREAIRKTMYEAVQFRRDKIVDCYSSFFNSLHGPLSNVGSGGWRQSLDGKTTYPDPLFIFTTNYDKCIDAFLNYRKIGMLDGIERKFGANYLNVHQFLEAKEASHYVKLHGSIDFYYAEGGGVVQVESQKRNANQITGEPTLAGIKLLDECMVYPTETGTDLRIIQAPYTDMYYVFRRALEIEPVQVYVGFSFRDHTIASLVQDVLIGSPEANGGRRNGTRRKLLLIDPKAPSICASLKSAGYDLLSKSLIPLASTMENPSLRELAKNALQV